LTWENRGYEAAERFARVAQYKFELGARRFEFENVFFMDEEMLKEPANGDLVIELSFPKQAFPHSQVLPLMPPTMNSSDLEMRLYHSMEVFN
jgi:hypothetical protein